MEAGAAAFQQFVDAPPPEGNVGAYNAFWLDFGTRVGDDRRSSLIIEPTNGRLPALAEGVHRQVGSLGRGSAGETPLAGAVGRSRCRWSGGRGLAERCLVGFNSGPPMMPSAYNNNMQLFQTADHVVNPQRDGARRADYPARRRSASAGRGPSVGRQLTGALGGRHAGGREPELLGQARRASNRRRCWRSAPATPCV